MTKRNKLAAYAISGIVIASCAVAYASGGNQPPDFGQDGPPMGGSGMGGPGGGSAVSAYGDNIFLVRGNALYQYSAKDLTVVKKVTLKLDQPTRPRNDGGGAPPELNSDPVLSQTGHQGSPLYASIQPPDFGGQGGPGGGMGMPPMGGGPGGGISISATASYVYITAGQTLYQYKVDGLTLNKKIKLPEIERPKRDDQ